MHRKAGNFLSEWMIFAFCAVISAFLLGYDIRHEHANITEREKQRLSAVATVAEYMLASQLETIDATLSKIRDTITLPGEEDPNEHPDSLHSTGARLKILAGAMTSVRSLAVIDARGVIASSNLDEIVGKDASQREYYLTPRRNPDPDVLFISPPFKNAIGEWVVHLSRAITAVDGSFAGVVTATLDPEFFRTLMNAVRYADNAWVRIVHGHGTVFVWEPARPNLVGANLARPGTFFTRHMESGQTLSLFQGRSYSTGEDSILVLQTVGSEHLSMDISLILGVGRDMRSIYADWRQQVQTYAIFFVSMAIIGALSLFGSQRWRVRSLREAERMGSQLRSIQAELESFFAIAPNLLSIGDFEGTCVKLNPAWQNLMGYAPGELEGRRYLDFFHPDDRDAGASILASVRDGQAITGFVARFRHKNGTYRYLEWSAAAFEVRIYSAAHDITERREAELRLHELAYHDRLTGLPNRMLFFDRLTQTLSAAKRGRKHAAILFLDLDGFKKVNDEYGHDAGDTVLKTVASRFLAAVRASDTVARMGGDEFVILLHELEETTDAHLVAQKLLDVVAPDIVLSPTDKCRVGASIGISIYPEHGTDMDTLLMAADMAMYDSKKRGANRYAFAGETPKTEEGIALDDAWLTGVREIDEQHREMAVLLNRLCATLANADNEPVIAECLYKMIVAFTEYHFATEHKLMRQHAYPGQPGHDAEHERLLRELSRFGPGMAEAETQFLVDYLRKWLLDHILAHDKALGAFLKETDAS
jgi:diguanylate cyclase (GGDEF)-like protein/hemerythrin-like metal-binding protein/PAS domain S-box-containing protein